MEEMIKAITKHSEMTKEEIKDVCVVGRGANARYPGFTYYTDTCEFYDDNEDAIWELLEEMAESMGEKPLALMAGFGCADSIYNMKTFKNALAWFALEEASNYLQRQEEEK